MKIANLVCDCIAIEFRLEDQRHSRHTHLAYLFLNCFYFCSIESIAVQGHKILATCPFIENVGWKEMQANRFENEIELWSHINFYCPTCTQAFGMHLATVSLSFCYRAIAQQQIDYRYQRQITYKFIPSIHESILIQIWITILLHVVGDCTSQMHPTLCVIYDIRICIYFQIWKVCIECNGKSFKDPNCIFSWLPKTFYSVNQWSPISQTFSVQWETYRKVAQLEQPEEQNYKNMRSHFPILFVSSMKGACALSHLTKVYNKKSTICRCIATNAESKK